MPSWIPREVSVSSSITLQLVEVGTNLQSCLGTSPHTSLCITIIINITTIINIIRHHTRCNNMFHDATKLNKMSILWLVKCDKVLQNAKPGTCNARLFGNIRALSFLVELSNLKFYNDFDDGFGDISRTIMIMNKDLSTSFENIYPKYVVLLLMCEVTIIQ